MPITTDKSFYFIEFMIFLINTFQKEYVYLKFNYFKNPCTRVTIRGGPQIPTSTSSLLVGRVSISICKVMNPEYCVQLEGGYFYKIYFYPI